MRVVVAKKIANEYGMELDYDNNMRLYILKDKELGWPDQYFPGAVVRTMDPNLFVDFYLRQKKD